MGPASWVCLLESRYEMKLLEDEPQGWVGTQGSEFVSGWGLWQNGGGLLVGMPE